MQSIAQMIADMEGEQELLAPDVPLFSNSHLMQEFLDSVMWRDILGQIAQFIISYRDELETAGKAEKIGMEDVAFTQGVCFALRTIAHLPNTLLQHFEAEEKEAQKEGEGDE